MGTPGLWLSEKETAIQAARQAGLVIAEKTGRVPASFKGRNDPVTEIDREAQRIVRRVIRMRFPDDGFLGEEDDGHGGSSEVPANGRRWIVDPIDGTMNFVRGLPFFAVSIALEADGELVAGSLFEPMRGEMFAAAKGHGTTLNGLPVRVSSVASAADALMTIGMPADPARVPGCFEVFEDLSRHCQAVRRLGSTAVSLAYLAAGRLDGFWAGQLRSWDSAAGIVLVREAGGRVGHSDGRPFDCHVPDILASNGLIHEELAGRIGRAVASAAGS
jgi:myo-inositol-1(or 4)-monophosphatase